MTTKSGIIKPRDRQRQGLYVGERRRADARPVRNRAAVADQVVAVVALRRFDRAEHFPTGITGPQLTLRKWVIRVSMSCIVRSLTGGVAKGWSDLYGPSGMFFTHCSMMRRLCRISSMRTAARS